MSAEKWVIAHFSYCWGVGAVRVFARPRWEAWAPSSSKLCDRGVGLPHAFTVSVLLVRGLVARRSLPARAGRSTHMLTEFQSAIAQLIHEKGLPQDKVMEAVAGALLAAYRKSVGGGENIRIEVERSGEVHVWATKRV